MECLVVSYCISKSIWEEQNSFIFHFRGVFAGHIVKRIEVLSPEDTFEVNEEYILHVRVLKVEESTLKCSILRRKLLSKIQSDFL